VDRLRETRVHRAARLRINMGKLRTGTWIGALEPVDGVSYKIRVSKDERDLCDIGNRDHKITEYFSAFCSSVSLTMSKINRILHALHYICNTTGQPTAVLDEQRYSPNRLYFVLL
jgi:hypothetical protein